MNFDRTTQQYFHFLEALGQAVIATDVTGTITSWSRAAEALYGWTRDEVIGRNVLEVTPMELSRAQGAEIMQALARGELLVGRVSSANAPRESVRCERHGCTPLGRDGRGGPE